VASAVACSGSVNRLTGVEVAGASGVGPAFSPQATGMTAKKTIKLRINRIRFIELLNRFICIFWIKIGTLYELSPEASK
jgi:hypothetical protein